MASSVLEFMMNPASYPDRPSQVELRQTHISWVFLTDTHAFKLKKPVCFDFLDFSSIELRRKACEDELRLNRRLAPDVYLEVIPITKDAQGHLQLKGHGEPIDWLVKMRRLDDQRSLGTMIRAGTIRSADVTRLAVRLARFYQDLPPVSMHPEDYRRKIDAHLRANCRSLMENVAVHERDLVKRVHSAQLTFLHTFPQTFNDRVCDGRIVEGHGDLRPEHIYLTPEPVIIDCLEFNAELREIDVLDELSFLAMECQRLHADWICEHIISHYAEAVGERPAPELTSFYKTYRACVRAKVALLQGGQLPASERGEAQQAARDYLRLADIESRQLGTPAVVVVRGPSGTGKTTISRALAELVGWELLETDVVRRELLDSEDPAAAYNEGKYSVENRNRVYEALFSRAERLVSHGFSVLLDGTFPTNTLQKQAAGLARRLGASLLLVNCSCAPDLAEQRIEHRQRSGDSLSDARIDILQRQLVEQEMPPADLPQCEIDTSCALPLIARTILDHLSGACRAEGERARQNTSNTAR